MATMLGPLQVAVTDLRAQPGVRRHVERSFESDGVSTSTAAVPPGAEVRLDLQIEAITGGPGGTPVVAEGTIATGWSGACRRCLELVEGTTEVDVREVFEERPTEGETYPIHDDVIDLGPMVRDALLLAMPLAPLCRPDCPGPAPDAFPTGPVADDAAAGAPDPRWSALDDLRFD